MKTRLVKKFTDSSEILFNKDLISKIHQENATGNLEFGVSFLDEALLGIQKNDLILLGAPSGAGKTELATHIAYTNALQKKKVVYFALEAEKYEIELRATYKQKALSYYRAGGKEYTSFDTWMQGKCGHIDSDEQVVSPIAKNYLTTRYVNGTYSIDNFLLDYTEIVNSSDLVILDHIHYFDLETTNENKEYKEIIKKIRTEVLEYGKPIIVISHIKKRDRRFPTLAPDQEDFHGTSDLVKIATKVISISPQYDFQIFQHMPGGAEVHVQADNFTFMRVAKNRRNGSVCRYISATKYDHRTNAYHQSYYLGTQKTKDKQTIFLTEESSPQWAKSSIT